MKKFTLIVLLIVFNGIAASAQEAQGGRISTAKVPTCSNCQESFRSQEALEYHNLEKGHGVDINASRPVRKVKKPLTEEQIADLSQNPNIARLKKMSLKKRKGTTKKGLKKKKNDRESSLVSSLAKYWNEFEQMVSDAFSPNSDNDSLDSTSNPESLNDSELSLNEAERSKFQALRGMEDKDPVDLDKIDHMGLELEDDLFSPLEIDAALRNIFEDNVAQVFDPSETFEGSEMQLIEGMDIEDDTSLLPTEKDFEVLNQILDTPEDQLGNPKEMVDSHICKKCVGAPMRMEDLVTHMSDVHKE